MKPVMTALLALVTLSASCVKEKQNIIPATPANTDPKPVPVAYRISTITMTDGYSKYVKTFTYNRDGYVVEYKMNYTHSTEQQANYQNVITFVRNSDNKILNEKTIDARIGDMTGEYQYNAGGQLAHIVYNYNADPDNIIHNTVFSWNNEHITGKSVTPPGSTNAMIKSTAQYNEQCNVSAIKNMSYANHIDQAFDISYDGKKNYHSTFKDKVAMIQIFGMAPETLSANNPVTYKKDERSITHEYTYNDDGLPLTIKSTNGYTTTIQYTEL